MLSYETVKSFSFLDFVLSEIFAIIKQNPTNYKHCFLVHVLCRVIFGCLKLRGGRTHKVNVYRALLEYLPLRESRIFQLCFFGFMYRYTIS